MSVYVQVFEALAGLAGGRVYPILADEGVSTPYIVVQRVGGAPVNFLTGEQPEQKHHRIQVSVWATTAVEAEEVAEQVEQAMRLAVALQPEVLGGAVDTYDELTTYRGTRQEFSLFF
ncbi:tail completion protein gp17 [Massilia sp. DD77]|uniref:tail completion protein gp17 n=1 Tax=Massilia sp. DD77 TaxID=3109349 RepID=UPI0030000803